MADFRCPNCGANANGGFMVCKDCGKVFCQECFYQGKAPYGSGACPRCASPNWANARDWSEMREALRNSQN